MATLPVKVTLIMRGESADDPNAGTLGMYKDEARARALITRVVQDERDGVAVPNGVLFPKSVTIDQDVGDLTPSQAQAAGWVVDVDELAVRATQAQQVQSVQPAPSPMQG